MQRECERQPKEQTARSLVGPIHYLGRNDTDQSAIFSIAGVRYEYFLRTSPQVHAIDFIARRKSNGKALAYAKRHATRCDRMTIPVATFPFPSH